MTSALYRKAIEGFGQRATGSDDQLDPEAVDACADWFATMEDEWRRRGAVGPPSTVSPDADAQTRLLASFGRPR